MNWSDLGTIAVVGATGAVGRELLSILSGRGVRPERILPLASTRSEGEQIAYGDGRLRVRSIDENSFHGADIAFFVADTETSRRFAPLAAERGAIVVDNSSAFRLAPAAPLVIPEINSAALSSIDDAAGSIIASPNCSTTILLLAIEPLRRRFGIRSINVATYQAVSGAGAAAMRELEDQTRAALDGQPVSPQHFHEPCAFNIFSHDSAVEPETGVNGEERKMIEESRKILAAPELSITPTCIRVPVRRAHTQAITVELESPATHESAHAAFESAPGAPGAPGVVMIDDRAGNHFPTPLLASGRDDILVGRLRPDPSDTDGGRGGHRRWCLMAAGDQLRKGAALNAVQIVETLRR